MSNELFKGIPLPPFRLLSSPRPAGGPPGSNLFAMYGSLKNHLDPSDIDGSIILYPARFRESLDWETINKLCEQNSDFEKFLHDVKIDFESKRIHRSEHDEVVKDIAKYIKSTLKIEQTRRRSLPVMWTPRLYLFNSAY